MGLSGGIDSALVAALAVDALGAENVRGLALPTEFSSAGSIDDARSLAANLGIRFDVVPIQGSFEALKRQMGPLFEGRPEDTTEENLQARLRGVTLMAMSNKFGSLLLTTGNKSELAVGYCTLYGDMCGGLAVISDLPKTWVYRVARWVNRDRELIPDSSITKAPSAELRPNQTDQDSLPPTTCWMPSSRLMWSKIVRWPRSSPGASARRMSVESFDLSTCRSTNAVRPLPDSRSHPAPSEWVGVNPWPSAGARSEPRKMGFRAGWVW